MSLSEGDVGKLLVAFYATDPEGVNFIAVAQSYASTPTFNFEGGGSWLSYLCREATPEESIDYWRRRALRAEDKHATEEATP